MADGEGRMLFDLRGKRRNVVKVVYAILALLMGASLILLAGPGLGGIGGGGSSGNGEAVERLEEQAVRTENKLAKSPEDADLLLSLMRTRISSSRLQSETGPNGEVGLTLEAREELEKASDAWSEYLKATDEPGAAAAQLITPGLFSLAQTSRTTQEADSNIRAAAAAAAIVGQQRPNLGSLSTAALYQLYAGEFKAAEQSKQEAAKFANSKSERESLGNQYDEVEKNAKKFRKQVAEAEKAVKESGGKESLQSPLGGALGGSSLSE